MDKFCWFVLLFIGLMVMVAYGLFKATTYMEALPEEERLERFHEQEFACYQFCKATTNSTDYYFFQDLFSSECRCAEVSVAHN